MMNLDPSGIYGAALVSSIKCAMLGSAALAFFYFWKRGLLAFDEGPKYQMMEPEQEKEGSHE